MCAVHKDNQSEDRVVATGDPRVYQPKGQGFVGHCSAELTAAALRRQVQSSPSEDVYLLIFNLVTGLA